MITFNECLLEYKNREDAINFSKKKIKNMSSYCKYVFESSSNAKPVYVESKEGEETFQVRAYPAYFKRVIMGVIYKVHGIEKRKLDIINTKPESVTVEEVKIYPPDCSGKVTAVNAPCNENLSNPVQNIKIRKRIPIVKPAYSAKPRQ